MNFKLSIQTENCPLQVDVLVALPPVFDHPNINEVVIDLGALEHDMNVFEYLETGDELKSFIMNLPVATQRIYKDPLALEIYEKRKSYDVILTDAVFNEVSGNVFEICN